MPTAQPNQSVQHAFEALEALAFAPAGMSTADLSGRLGLGKPVISRLMHTLLDLGYVGRVGRGQWRAHAGLLALGVMGLRHSPLARGRERLQELSRQLGCFVAAGFVWRRQVVYVFGGTAGVVGPIGGTFPVEDSSIGRLLTGRSPRAQQLVWRRDGAEFSLAVPFTFDGVRYGLAVAAPAALNTAETAAALRACAAELEALDPLQERP